MATELAKAYVQIIPSADGIKGRITEALGGEASSAGESSGQTIGQKMVSAIKKIVVAAGIGKAFTESLNQGAELQQSIGGIETLFKDSADKVKEYASQAYKTAGLSANEYMETVTSFSASLLQSLSGDTEEAATKADMALTDMSDNANKMGTDMESIQNAYQGFAKANYTMLDNLKLGYGGTQAEMQRLLKDAQAISGVEYDISSYADIVDAIHVVQTEMGITGTTALEASETFSGSLASMKAAAKDLLGNLSLGASIGPSLNALLETAQTFLVGNLLPMVGNILTELPGLAVSLIAGAGNLFLQLAAELPGLVSDILENIRGLLVTGLEAIGLDGAAEMLAGFSNPLNGFSLQDLLDKFGEAAAFLSETFSPVLDAIDDLFAAIGDAVGPVVDSVGDFLTSEETASTITDTLSAAVEGVALGLEQAVTLLTQFVTWVTSGTPGAETFKAVIVGIAAGFTAWQIIGSISTLVTTVTSVVSAAKTAFAAFNAVLAANPIGIVITVIAALVAAFIYLWNNCEEFRNFWSSLWETVKSAVSTAIDGIVGFFSGLWNTIESIWENIKETVSSAWETICNVVQVSVMLLGEILNAAFQIITLPFAFIWENCRETIETAWNAIQTFVSSALDTVSNVISSVMDIISGVISTIWGTISQTISTVMSTISNVIATVWDTISSTVSGAVNTVKTTISNVFSSVRDTVTTIWNAIKAAISTPINAAKATVSGVVNTIKSTASNVFTALKTTVSSIWNDIKTAITNPIQTAKDTVKNLIDKIKGFFNFEWSLPKLKMPHVTITGSFSLVPPSVPKFSISWYRSAMDSPMLLTNASIFGAAGGTLLGGGEAGPEVVSGADTLMNMIRSVLDEGVTGTNDALDDKFDQLLDLLAEYFPQLANMRVYLDETTMVGRMAPAMNTALGRIQAKEARQR